MKFLILLIAAIIFGCLSSMANAFTCASTGLFANTDTNDCKTFVSCGYTMQPQVHSCPDNSYFWPAKKGCFSQYNCAQPTLSGNTNPCEGNNDYDIPDPNSSDCSKYIQCSWRFVYNKERFYYRIVASVQCANGSDYRPGVGCVRGYKCAKYPCANKGYFPNPNSVDCTTFVDCWERHLRFNTGSVTSFHSNVASCPTNSKFNPQFNKCDSYYNCDQNDPYGGVDPCDGSIGQMPIVPNPFDSTDKSYLSCRYGDHHTDEQLYVYRDGILKTECPPKTLFSSHLKKCYAAHVANENCSRDPCSSGAGQYVNYASGGCQSFIECRDNAIDGIMYKPTYEIRYCPPGTLFEPAADKATGECVSGYSCPSFPANYCYAAVSSTTTSKVY